MSGSPSRQLEILPAGRRHVLQLAKQSCVWAQPSGWTGVSLQLDRTQRFTCCVAFRGKWGQKRAGSPSSHFPSHETTRPIPQASKKTSESPPCHGAMATKQKNRPAKSSREEGGVSPHRHQKIGFLWKTASESQQRLNVALSTLRLISQQQPIRRLIR